MLDVNKIKCGKLKKLAKDGDESRIRADWRKRVKRILAALNVATSPSELDLPGLNWHELKGSRKGTYSVLVSGNWRITYQWNDWGPHQVDLEDYHGN